MQYTKIESRILKGISSGKIERNCKITLWVGIILVVASFVIAIGGYRKIQAFDSLLYNQYLQTQKDILPGTEPEKTESAGVYKPELFREKILRLHSNLLLLGVFLIASSVTARIYSNLVKKIKNLANHT